MSRTFSPANVNTKSSLSGTESEIKSQDPAFLMKTVDKMTAAVTINTIETTMKYLFFILLNN
jgi:hypothetical protein